MHKQLKLNKSYNSLVDILEFILKESNFSCSKEYDIWDVRTDANGQMEECILIKKSNMHGMKVYLTQGDVLDMTYVIPNKIMNAYFGKSQKRYRNILEIVAGFVKDAVLASSQKQAFEEMEGVFKKIAA